MICVVSAYISASKVMLLILPSNAEPSINVRLVPSIGSAAKLNVDSELPPLIIRVVASESLANLSAAWVRATDFEAPTVTSSVSKLSIVATLASPLNDNLTVSLPAPPSRTCVAVPAATVRSTTSFLEPPVTV